MPSDIPRNTADPTSRAGPTRTPWHPMLVRLLRWLLRGAYEVREEVYVGVMPPRIDIVLVRKTEGHISPASASYMPELIPRLRMLTSLELKGPTDALQFGDYELHIGHLMLYLQQESELLPNRDISLIFIAPTLTRSFVDGLKLRELTIREEPLEPGVHRILGGPFDTWVIETDEMAKRDRPLFSLFSRLFLRDPRGIIENLVAGGYTRALFYVMQQVRQFQGKDSSMVTMLPDVGGPELDPEVIEEFLRMFTPEKRMQGLSPEERVAGLKPEERVAGLKPEERVFGLSLEERVRLKKLLEDDVALKLGDAGDEGSASVQDSSSGN
jgi:hypothetical protein